MTIVPLTLTAGYNNMLRNVELSQIEFGLRRKLQKQYPYSRAELTFS
jgi:hypothetical protein